MDIQKVALRLATRTDVLRQVESAFMGQNLYPPNMKIIDKDTYEGEIDDGWTLKVIEEKSGNLNCFLNEKVIGSPKDAAIAYKKKDPSFLKSKDTHTKSEDNHIYAEKRVYCLYPIEPGEQGGDIERYFDLDVYDEGNDKYKVVIEWVDGEPISDPQVREGILTMKNGVLEGTKDSDGLLEYIATNGHFYDEFS